MAQQAAAKTSKKASGPRLKHVDSILDELNELRGLLTHRAYEIFDGRGRQHGRDLDDWLDAKRELVWSPPIELTETDGKLTLEAAVAGVEPEDLEVQVTPEDVLIRSSRVYSETAGVRKVHASEFRAGKLFRDVHLPAHVDPKGAEAEYHNGMLRVTLPIRKDRRASKRIEIAGE